MQNDEGKNMDLYVPRKCSATNQLITSKDHASVQINVGHVDPTTGRYTGRFTTYALSGFVRAQVGSSLPFLFPSESVNATQLTFGEMIFARNSDTFACSCQLLCKLL